MPANLENSAVATGLEKVSFHSNLKEGQYQRMFKLPHNSTHFSHASKVMLKILQARLQQYVNQELPDVPAGFRKAEEPEIKWPISTGSQKKQENSRKTSNSASMTMPKPLTVWTTTNWKIFISDYVTCLLRNLQAGQEATGRTRHGTMDWFQTGKGVHQGCILLPCLFNLYAEYLT